MKRALQIVVMLAIWVSVVPLLPPSRWTPPVLLRPATLTILTAPFRAPAKPYDVAQTPVPSVDMSVLAAPIASTSAKTGAAVPAPDTWPGFIAKLRDLEANKNRTVRIAHLGDSELVADGTSAAARRTLAKRFGWGALGFSSAMLPLPWYERDRWRHHQGQGGVKVWAYPYGKLDHGKYGPGGVGFELGSGTRASTELDHPVDGGCVVRFFYLQKPNGGTVTLSADEEVAATIETAGRQKLASWSKRIDKCPSKLTMVTSIAATMVYGWHVDYDRPGIEWSSLGVISARLSHLEHYDHENLRASLAALNPDLLVMTFGLNVAAQKDLPTAAYQRSAARGFRQVRAAMPAAACLVTGPYPFGTPDPYTGPRVAAARAVSAFQKAAAEEAGCTFLDRFNLSGGASAALRWGTARPKVLAGDYQHLTVEGSDRMGRALARTIEDAVDGRDGAAAARYFGLER